MNSTSHIVLTNDRGLRFSVPFDLSCITTFVLLEQGRWFEKELQFIYRVVQPGSVAIDIGANVGVYTIPLSRIVGPTGVVIAYEPGEENRRHLERSLELNCCESAKVFPTALSNSVGTGLLKIAGSGELNMLISAAEGNDQSCETVGISTLDVEMDRLGWPQVAFMKMDAEGQEIAIIRGGSRFFATQDPLILFEIKHGHSANVGLVEELRSVGFDIYRLLGDASLLVPVSPDETPDSYELNYFAAKPATADKLESAGLLVRQLGEPELTISERRDAIACYCALPFAAGLQIDVEDVEHCPFGEALTCFAAYCFVPTIAPSKRVALLLKSERLLAQHVGSNGSAAALLTYSRVSLALGEILSASTTLRRLAGSPMGNVDQPFFPPLARQDQLQLVDDESVTFAVNEALSFVGSHSFLFGHDQERVRLLENSPAASPDLIRRAVVVGLYLKREHKDIRSLLARLPAAECEYDWAWRNAVDSFLAAG